MHRLTATMQPPPDMGHCRQARPDIMASVNDRTATVLHEATMAQGQTTPIPLVREDQHLHTRGFETNDTATQRERRHSSRLMSTIPNRLRNRNVNCGGRASSMATSRRPPRQQPTARQSTSSSKIEGNNDGYRGKGYE
jgi:hypothetical protein